MTPSWWDSVTFHSYSAFLKQGRPKGCPPCGKNCGGFLAGVPHSVFLCQSHLIPHHPLRHCRRKNMSMRLTHSKPEGFAWWSKAEDTLGFNAGPADPANISRACQSIWPAINKERKFISNFRWNMPVLLRQFQVCRFRSSQTGKKTK